LEELIDAGAINQLNTCDKDGRTPLHLACVYKPFESDAIDVLLQAGARTDVWDSKGRTPLMYACYNFPIRVEYVRSLLNAGADVRARSPQGDTALSLFLAGRTSETEDDAVVATLLCNAGAEVDTVDALGRTPLHGLCRRGTAPGLARLLLERKASVASRDARGATPLLEACASGSVDTVLLLMESGADLLAEDADGVTALMRLAELRLDRGEKPLRRFVAGLVEVIERMHD
jgi:ankyrin repeat protein